MTSRVIARVVAVLAVALASAVPALAQPQAGASDVSRYIDPVQGASIDDLVAQALAAAPDLLAARAREAEARGAALQAGLRPNPIVSMQRRDETDTPGHQTTVGLTWPLDLFRRDSRVAAADEGARLAAGATDQARWRLATEVRAQAGRVLAAVRRLEIAADVAATARETYELVAARAESGAGPPLERDQAEIGWRRREAEALRVVGDVDAELARLKALVGVDQATPLRLRTDLEQATRDLRRLAATDARADEADWLGRRPDIRLARIQIDRAVASEAAARQAGRFDLALTAAYSRTRAGFPLQGLNASGQPAPITGRTHSLAVGVNLTLPWRNDNRGAVAAASAAVTTAERVLDARRLDADAEVEAARRRDASAGDALAALGGQARQLAARNLDVVRESHELGRATLTDVLDETRRYLDFELAYTAALADAFLTRVALTAALGDVR